MGRAGIAPHSVISPVRFLAKTLARPLVQLRHAALTVSVSRLEGGTTLPALPECVQMLEALVERGRIDRKLGKGDGGGHRDVREGRRISAENPVASVREMLVDQARVRQRFLAGMFAPGMVGCQFELRSQ